MELLSHTYNNTVKNSKKTKTLFKDHLNKDEKKKTKGNKGSKAKKSVKFNLEVQERTVFIN